MHQKTESQLQERTQNNTKILNNDIPSVYEDKFAKITPYFILIDKYYFPLATSKTIFYNEIERIQIKDAERVNTTWGLSRSQLNHWFHLDSERKKRKKYLSIVLKDRKVKVGLTLQRPEEAFQCIRKLVTSSSSKQQKDKYQLHE